MGIFSKKNTNSPSSSSSSSSQSSSRNSTSHCSDLRTAYHNCFNRPVFLHPLHHLKYWFFCVLFALCIRWPGILATYIKFLPLQVGCTFRRSSVYTLGMTSVEGEFASKWYSEKFVKGDWQKEECVAEWAKYRDCLSKHLEDKHLSRFLEPEACAVPSSAD